MRGRQRLSNEVEDGLGLVHFTQGDIRTNERTLKTKLMSRLVLRFWLKFFNLFNVLITIQKKLNVWLLNWVKHSHFLMKS